MTQPMVASTILDDFLRATPPKTVASFVQPAVGGTVVVAIEWTQNLGVGLFVFLPVGGYYLVTAIGDPLHATLQNIGVAGGASQGTTIADETPVIAAGKAGATGATGPQGPTGSAGPTGPQGPAGSGTTIGPTAANILTSATLSNGALVRLNADASQATQITLTFGASPSAGDSYFIKCTGSPVTGNPVLVTDSVHTLEDPANPGTYGHGPFAMEFQGQFCWWQFNSHTSVWDLLINTAANA